ncbi:hypothetical protein MRX96_055500 [Rhipicephalus microplus]
MGYLQIEQASSVLGLLGRRPARLQHLLHDVEPHPRLRLVLDDREVVEHVEVAQVRSVAVTVLVHEPLVAGRVGVSRADVLGLQVFQLTVDVVAVTHFAGV